MMKLFFSPLLEHVKCKKSLQETIICGIQIIYWGKKILHFMCEDTDRGTTRLHSVLLLSCIKRASRVLLQTE